MPEAEPIIIKEKESPPEEMGVKEKEIKERLEGILEERRKEKEKREKEGIGWVVSKLQEAGLTEEANKEAVIEEAKKEIKKGGIGWEWKEEKLRRREQKIERLVNKKLSGKREKRIVFPPLSERRAFYREEMTKKVIEDEVKAIARKICGEITKEGENWREVYEWGRNLIDAEAKREWEKEEGETKEGEEK